MFRQVLGVVKELVTDYHPPKELKNSGSPLPSTPARVEISKSSEQKELALIDPVTESKPSASPSTTTAVMLKLENKENQKQEEQTILDGLLPLSLQGLILGYLDANVPEDYQTKLICTSPLFLSKLTEVFTREIAYDLLWHLRIHDPRALIEILDYLKQNPVCLTTVVEIKDPYGQRVKNTILNIMRSAGDRDPCKMEEGTHYGLVELLKPCFESIKDEYKEYKRQVAEWDAKAVDATAVTMQPYEEAYMTLCDKIIQDTKEIPAFADDKTFETLLDLKMAQEFREALKPNPKHIVESGFLFDFGILLKFYDYWEEKVEALGLWDSVKNLLFGTIVYLAFQARVQRIDKDVFKKGIENVNNGETPNRIDYTNGVSGAVCGLTAQELKDHGARWFFGVLGDKFEPGRRRRGIALSGAVSRVFLRYLSNKNNIAYESSKVLTRLY